MAPKAEKPTIFVVYKSDDEAIVTTPEKEKSVRRRYFGKNRTGCTHPGYRSLDDYERFEVKEPCVCLTSAIKWG